MFAKLCSKLFVKSKVLPEKALESLAINPNKPTFYISLINSRADQAALARVCKRLGLADPFTQQQIGDASITRFIPLKQRPSLFAAKSHTKSAIAISDEIFAALEKYPQEVQVIPVTILWGRNPGKEKPGLSTLLTHSLTPGPLRKFFVMLFSGRDNFIRFSQPVDLSQLKQKHLKGGLSQKLVRVAQVHFKRQKLAATGPKLPSRDSLFQSILASNNVRKAIDDEAKQKHISKHAAKQEAAKLLDEIAANYNDAMIRVAERLLTWLWTKLYNGIEVNNVEKVQELSNKGHEIIYMPCHRSHMDYLLLTYVIYHQGFVPPHIAAGVNLNFWPAGPIFRRSGAFFLRRSFQGNKLYSTVFKEYLAQLFVKGYAVKFYTEGGRSRTGRLLEPKTGMLAMTLQAMLRGIERPISIVPVYIGYEHVMEVNTYLKELAGSKKKNESIMGVFKTIRKLKNYGKGNLNFGEPININQFLNKHQSDWRDAINGDDSQKPEWLPKQVANLSQQVMVHINQSAAVNAVTLLSTILLSTHTQTMTKLQLVSLMTSYLELLRAAPYHKLVSLPEQDAEALLSHALTLNKFEQTSDNAATIVAVKDSERVLLNYYRNNVFHLFALPSLVALLAIKQPGVSKDTLTNTVKQIYPLLQNELFLHDFEQAYLDAIIENLVSQKLLLDHGDVYTPAQCAQNAAKLEQISRVIEVSLMRFSAVTKLYTKLASGQSAQLQAGCELIAKRLAQLHGIKTPEFFDAKVLKTLTQSIEQIANESPDQLSKLEQQLDRLLDAEWVVSIENAVAEQK